MTAENARTFFLLTSYCLILFLIFNSSSLFVYSSRPHHLPLLCWKRRRIINISYLPPSLLFIDFLDSFSSLRFNFSLFFVCIKKIFKKALFCFIFQYIFHCFVVVHYFVKQLLLTLFKSLALIYRYINSILSHHHKPSVLQHSTHSHTHILPLSSICLFSLSPHSLIINCVFFFRAKKQTLPTAALERRIIKMDLYYIIIKETKSIKKCIDAINQFVVCRFVCSVC